MHTTLQNLIDSYRSGLLSTPNIQVIDKKLSDETIQFPKGLFVDSSLSVSTFKNSDLINMKFINVSFESSYFDNCMFNNCRFINCDLSDLDVTKTIFNECTFLKCCFNNAVFELCHFLKPILEGVKGGPLGSAVLIDSKFSNSKKSIEFEGEVYFNTIFDQIDKLHID